MVFLTGEAPFGGRFRYKGEPDRPPKLGVKAVPTYTYQCKDCGHSFDLFHGISATPRVKCEKCKGKCIRLIGTGAGIIFKGSGFYQTDYKNNGSSRTESRPAKPDSTSSGKGEASGGTKPSAAAAE